MTLTMSHVLNYSVSIDNSRIKPDPLWGWNILEVLQRPMDINLINDKYYPNRWKITQLYSFQAMVF